MTTDLELSWSMKVYNGLGKDIEQLMHRFVETGSVRYEGFARIWQEMNFTLVYCGLKSLENMREFMEEAFRLSSLYLSPPFDFQQRTGGLYIIYAFYFTQRHRPRIKVRLSPQQWKDLVYMEGELKKQRHLDAYYILLKLKMHKAFCIAYSSQQFIFKHPLSEDSQDKWLAENQREIEQAFPESLLRKLHETHHKYQHLKNQLGVGEERCLKYVKHSMAEVIANRFTEIEEKLDDTPRKRDRTDRVAKIKEKSFLHGVESDNRVTSPSSNTTSSGSDHPTSPNRKRRGRRRRRSPPPQPDTRPIVERLMPVLKEYRLSDSEEEGELKTAADARVGGEQPKQPEASETKSPTTKTPKNSPTKRKRKPVKTPAKKPRKAEKMSSTLWPAPAEPKEQGQRKSSPRKGKGTVSVKEGAKVSPKRKQTKAEKKSSTVSPAPAVPKEQRLRKSSPRKGKGKGTVSVKGGAKVSPKRKQIKESPSPTRRKSTPRATKRSGPATRATPGTSKRMAKIRPLTE